MNKISIIILLLSVPLFQTCDNNDELNEDNEILGKKWILVKHIGSAGTTVPTDVIPEPGEEYWIQLNFDGTITAHDACNSCPGLFEFQDNDFLMIENMACTEMACAGDSKLMLNSTFSHSVNNDTLILIDEHSFSGQALQFVQE